MNVAAFRPRALSSTAISVAEVAACRDALDACLAAGTDKKTCFEADHACMKAAFEAAMAAAGDSSASTSDAVK